MPTSTVQAVPKLYDVILWLMGRVEKFPRSQKFTLGDRTVNLALDTLELLIEATYTRDRLTLVRKANVQEKLRYLKGMARRHYWDRSSQISTLYNVQAIPSTFLIDGAGIVRVPRLKTQSPNLCEEIYQI